MKELRRPYFLSVVALAALLAAVDGSGRDGSTTSAVYSACSDLDFPPSSPYQRNLESLLSSLSTAAAYSLYSNFSTSIASPRHPPVSGLYQCDGDLSLSGCDSCVRAAVDQLPSVCSRSVAATVRLRGCLLTYGNDSFVGESDKSLQFKRCGPGGSAGANDPSLMQTRDEVLGALAEEQGTAYRVSQSGGVRGAAQCVGDQDAKQCEDCLGEAVSDLKTLCAGALAGEVYLAKCYAEYSAQGMRYYYSSSKRDGPHNAGRDLAIIIGVVAAVVLFILFINYLRKSAEEKGEGFRPLLLEVRPEAGGLAFPSEIKGRHRAQVVPFLRRRRI